MDAGKVDDDGSLREGVTRAGGDVEAGEGDAGNEFADRRYRGHVFYYPWYDNPEHNKNKVALSRLTGGRFRGLLRLARRSLPLGAC